MTPLHALESFIDSISSFLKVFLCFNTSVGNVTGYICVTYMRQQVCLYCAAPIVTILLANG